MTPITQGELARPDSRLRAPDWSAAHHSPGRRVAMCFSVSATPETLSRNSVSKTGPTALHQAPPASATRYRPHHRQNSPK